YRPRRRQPQSLGEELFLHPPRLTSSGGPFHTRRDGAMKRLFGSIVTAQYSGDLQGSRGFLLRNVVLADEVKLNESTFEKNLEEQLKNNDNSEGVLWVPQKENAGKWKSELRLSQQFFNECVERPVPIDLRAYKALRGSPLAMDIYTWMTYRMSYTNRATRPIPWDVARKVIMSDFARSKTEPLFRKVSLLCAKADDASEGSVDVHPCTQSPRCVPARDCATPGYLPQYRNPLPGLARRTPLQAT
ncbi:replication protein RepA, partial [Ralstonia mannitolilytica]|uniref:replication protein RepA n=1 Tax=Ralstonia mannitolilytica TaxID=105219 RepID=UPI002930431D